MLQPGVIQFAPQTSQSVVNPLVASAGEGIIPRIRGARNHAGEENAIEAPIDRAENQVPPVTMVVLGQRIAVDQP
jgi:hypothetical protein